MIETIQISQQVYMLKDSAECYSTLVLGEKQALLFDTGCGMDNLKEAVESITKLPLLVILSHGHFDHIGGSFQFEKAYMSPKDQMILDTYDDEILNRWIREMSVGDSQTISTNGWRQIQDLDFTEFDLGNLQGHIVELPGHSAGSVGIFFPDLKMLLASDALSPIMCLMFLNHGDKTEQLNTLKKVLEYDFSCYLTSHSQKIYPKELIYRMISCIEDSEGKRHHKYKYPKPPYSEGFFYLHSMKDEPVGLIVEK